MGKLFGTDGVRGVANSQLTPELAFKLGRVGAYFLAGRKEGARVLVGRDTRISGQMLEAALTAGILSVGVDVGQVGIVPTPAVAFLIRELGADAGVVISASHNPVEDNGIKFFSAAGYKLSDSLEEKMEKLLEEQDTLPRPTGEKVGRLHLLPQAREGYLKHLENLTPVSFEGLKIVVDCANGAAYQFAPEILRRQGAQVIPFFQEPDGVNINVGCGSTHPLALQEAVVQHGAHMGLAFDGDADRVLAVDEKGRLVDGDQIMCIAAMVLAASGQLKGRTLVTTVMSNLGLDLALKEHGIRVTRTKVGDRYVLAEMQRLGANLGGEQSGHIIFLDHNTTGDGLITALQLVSMVKRSGKPLSHWADVMPRLPQVQKSIRVSRREEFTGNGRVQEAIAAAQESFSGMGRVVVRPSGTEPVIRVMVEGEKEEELQEIASKLVKVIGEELG